MMPFLGTIRTHIIKKLCDYINNNTIDTHTNYGKKKLEQELYK